MYDSDRDPYLYDGTTVLKNLFDFRDPAALKVVERQLTRARAEQGLPAGDLDYAHPGPGKGNRIICPSCH